MNTNINLTSTDEYAIVYCTDTFPTLEDAKEALWQMECALEDTRSSATYYNLQCAITDLRNQISEHEDAN